MTDIRLKTFLCLVGCKSYTETARLMHMTQPAVSQHIKKLEAEYGCRLFELKNGTLTLSKSGELLKEYAELSLANEELLRRRLKNSAEPLKIGATLTAADHYLDDILPILTDFGNLGGKSGLYICTGNTVSLTAALLSGEISCAFVEGMFDTSLFVAHEFCTASLVGVCRAGHPAAAGRIRLSELFDYPLIMREKGSGTRAVFEEYLAMENIPLSSWSGITCAGSLMLIKKLLLVGNGISFIYSRAVQREVCEKSLAVLDIDGFSIQKPMHFIYPKNSAYTHENETLFLAVSSVKRRQDNVNFAD